MLLTASRSRREGVGARASLEAAALEAATLETVTGATGDGDSARRRAPVRAAATIAAPFSGAAPWALREASFGWSWAFGEEGTTGVDWPCRGLTPTAAEGSRDAASAARGGSGGDA